MTDPTGPTRTKTATGYSGAGQKGTSMFIAKVKFDDVTEPVTIGWRKGQLFGDGAELVLSRLDSTRFFEIVGMPIYEGRDMLQEGCIFVAWLHRESDDRVELLQGRFPKPPVARDGAVN